MQPPVQVLSQPQTLIETNEDGVKTIATVQTIKSDPMTEDQLQSEIDKCNARLTEFDNRDAETQAKRADVQASKDALTTLFTALQKSNQE